MIFFHFFLRRTISHFPFSLIPHLSATTSLCPRIAVRYLSSCLYAHLWVSKEPSSLGENDGRWAQSEEGTLVVDTERSSAREEDSRPFSRHCDMIPYG